MSVTIWLRGFFSLPRLVTSIENCPTKLFFQIKLVRSKPRSAAFESSFKESHHTYYKYQTTVHSNPPEKPTEKQYTRFLVDSPLAFEVITVGLFFFSFFMPYLDKVGPESPAHYRLQVFVWWFLHHLPTLPDDDSQGKIFRVHKTAIWRFSRQLTSRGSKAFLFPSTPKQYHSSHKVKQKVLHFFLLPICTN